MSHIGMQILRQTTPPEWLIQPPGSQRLHNNTLDIFKQTPCQDAWWSTQRPIWKYDKHSAYLGCASSVRCGVGSYKYQINPVFPDGSSYPPGVWYVEMLAESGMGYEGPGWYYSPLLRLWREMEQPFVTPAAYTWAESHQCLSGFYRAVKSLRTEDEQASKWLYKKTFGMLAHWPLRPDGTPYRTLPEGMLYRPDWWNLLRAELKARMYYHAWQVWQTESIWPCWLHYDELGYDRQVHSLRLGEEIGAFRERGPLVVASLGRLRTSAAV